MFGAIYGDVIGSYYESHCTKDYNFEFHRESTFTDDSVMTAAVCKAILLNPSDITISLLKNRAKEYALQYKQYYSYFPNAGYGYTFSKWAKEHELSINHSYANGCAMRVIPIGYAYNTIEQVQLQAKASCMYSHRHFESIKGAQAVASCIFLANNGASKNEIKNYIQKKFKYNLNTTVNKIRSTYEFDSKTKYSIPPSIIAFLDSDNYESAIRNAISLGGDADTMACIAGGIAECYYKEIPEHIQTFCDLRIDSSIKLIIREFMQLIKKDKLVLFIK